jgi:hypothetical protein
MEAALRWLAEARPGSAEMLRLMDATPVPCGQSAVIAKRSDLYGWAGYGYFLRAGPLRVPGLSGDPLRRGGPYPARTNSWCGNGDPDRRLGSPAAWPVRARVYDTTAALLSRVGEPFLAWAAADRAMFAEVRKYPWRRAGYGGAGARRWLRCARLAGDAA